MLGGKKMFSTFTESATVITTGINQIYSRQTQGIIIFCAAINEFIRVVM